MLISKMLLKLYTVSRSNDRSRNTEGSRSVDTTSADKVALTKAKNDKKYEGSEVTR